MRQKQARQYARGARKAKTGIPTGLAGLKTAIGLVLKILSYLGPKLRDLVRYQKVVSLLVVRGHFIG